MELAPLTLCRSQLETPLGRMIALATDQGLCALEFSRSGPHARLAARLARWFPPHDVVDAPSPILERTRAWVSAYFDGVSADPGDLPLDLRGAPFERRVWAALLQIPAGTTSSYGAIAGTLGAPRASRAVGAANGANPVSLIVPCHRVIGTSGRLVGYGGGLDRKKWLLNHERKWARESQPSLL